MKIQLSCYILFISTLKMEKIKRQTFGEAQFLCDSASDFGRGGIAVEIDLIHAVPINMGPTELQTVDGCGGGVWMREGQSGKEG